LFQNFKLGRPETLRNGKENETFPEMMDKQTETMGALSGKEEPLKGAIVEGNTGYFSEGNLREAGLYPDG
jgi:hypothetical protein